MRGASESPAILIIRNPGPRHALGTSVWHFSWALNSLSSFIVVVVAVNTVVIRILLILLVLLVLLILLILFYPGFISRTASRVGHFSASTPSLKWFESCTD